MFYLPDTLYINLATGKIGDGDYWNKKVFEVFTRYRPRGQSKDLDIRDLGIDIEELYEFDDD